MSIRSFTVFILLTLFATASFADTIQVISTPAAPRSSSYSQGMQFSDLVFVAGQIPRYPEGSDETGDIVAQTGLVMNNIQAILEAADLDFCDVVMSTVYLNIAGQLVPKNPPNEFTEFNNKYKSYFAGCLDILPARATVEVDQIPGNPRFKIEISVIAAQQSEN